MKTKKRLLLFVVLSFMIITTHAQQMCVDTLSGNPIQTFYVCGSTLEVFTNNCPAADCYWWNNGSSTDGQSSVIMTSSGECKFHCDSPPDKKWWVYFVTAPPTYQLNGGTTANCGVIHCQLLAQPGTTYQWYKDGVLLAGQTGEFINVTDTGHYTVNITNACGSITDGITVTWQGNLPIIPLTGTFCYGSPMILDVFGGPYNYYNWSTGQSGPSLSQIIVDTTATYTVTVTNSGGCQTSASTNMVFPEPDSAIICNVDYDPNYLGGKNRIFVKVSSDSTVVERKTSSTTWETRFVLAPGQTDSLDVTSTPPTTAHYYRAYHKKECGSVGILSETHVTIPLTISYDPLSYTYGLTWPEYIGFGNNNGPSIYIIFGVLPNGAVDSLGFVPGGALNHQYAFGYTNQNCPYVKFYIAFYSPICNGIKSMHGYTKSPFIVNPFTVGVQEEDKNNINIFPNPTTTGILNIVGMEEEYYIDVYNFSGQIILRTENEKSIDLSQFSPGIYFIRISTDEKVYPTQKVTKR